MKAMIEKLSQYGIAAALVVILGVPFLAINPGEMSVLSKSWLSPPERIAPAAS